MHLLPRAVLALAGALFVCAPAFAETWHRSGPASERLDISILADGFTADEEDEFRRDARKVFDQLRGLEPFNQYMGLLNVHVGFRASSRSGLRSDSAYGTEFAGSGFFSTLLRAQRISLIQSDAVRAGGDADVILVLVNSNRRGGTAYGKICYSSSGATATALHELGHSLGGLGDEYGSWSGTPKLTRAQYDARYPNLTTQSSRDRLPWKDWVDSGTRVPASFFTSGVSAHKGGGAYADGLYRPERGCRMRNDHNDFCKVCRQHLVLKLHQGSRAVKLEQSGGRVRVISPLAADRWAARWTGAQGNGLEAIANGGRVSVSLEDRTPWVRGSFRSTLRYQLSTTASGGGSPSDVTRSGSVTGVTSRLRVRAGSSTSSAIVGHLGPNERVQVVGAAVDGFYPIVFEGGRGFVGESFVELDPLLSGRVVGITSRLRVRASASTASNVLGHLGPNEAVAVTGPEVDGFYPIVFNGGQGYVGANYIALDTRSGLSRALRR